LDVEVVIPGGAYLPAVFGEGSLWAIDPATCNDAMSVSGSASSSGGASFPSTIMESSAQASCLPPDETPLKRLDPQTGEEEATITLEGFFEEARGQVAVGAGSVWALGASEDSHLLLRVDPETNRVADRIPLDSPPTSLAFGHGSVWVTSSGRGTLSRVDPRTGEVAAEIGVGRGATDVAADGGSGDVWVACWGGAEPEHNQLSRVDPEANRVVAQIPIVEHARYGGPQGVSLGEGAVWAQGARGGLFKVDPATNEVVAERDLGGDSTSDLAAYGGAVWIAAQVSVGTRLYRIDPHAARVVASEHGPDPSGGGFGGLVAGGGYVWFESGDGLARVAP
jgi:streptogramin lyase